MDRHTLDTLRDIRIAAGIVEWCVPRGIEPVARYRTSKGLTENPLPRLHLSFGARLAYAIGMTWDDLDKVRDAAERIVL